MENTKNRTEFSPQPKNKSKKWFWIFISILLIILFAVLIFHKPAYYKPVSTVNSKQLSPYLLNQLMPEFYNGIQKQEPFDFIITEKGINEVVSSFPFCEQFQKHNLTNPVIKFGENKVIFVTGANVSCANLVLTAEFCPVFDTKGKMNINTEKIRMGAINITFAAKLFADKILAKIEDRDENTNLAKFIVKTYLIDSLPFEPVFKIDDKKIRLSSINIHDFNLTFHLTPANSSTLP